MRHARRAGGQSAWRGGRAPKPPRPTPPPPTPRGCSSMRLPSCSPSPTVPSPRRPTMKERKGGSLSMWPSRAPSQPSRRALGRPRQWPKPTRRCPCPRVSARCERHHRQGFGSVRSTGRPTRAMERRAHASRAGARRGVSLMATARGERVGWVGVRVRCAPAGRCGWGAPGWGAWAAPAAGARDRAEMGLSAALVVMLAWYN
mmetsp:Transcript_69859/g.191671  ORF Transcript_69859/g.191671 Transcript_69859/m.191671 type:complete len:202 (-) Transcript_69859:29-634(-)|eukprot:7355884-Prymnesium_polylepis.1